MEYKLGVGMSIVTEEEAVSAGPTFSVYSEL